MYAKIFDNYHAGVRLMDRADQDAFYGSVMRYVFDGEEPDFDGIQEALWATIKPLVDKSIEGQENGAKGGNGRGNRNPSGDGKATGKGPSKTTQQKGGEKPPSKTQSENQKNRREVNGNEGNGNKNPEDFIPIPPEGGAGSGVPAPPSEHDDSSVPVCPLCSKPVRFDIKESAWVCGMCGTVKEPEYREVAVA